MKFSGIFSLFVSLIGFSFTTVPQNPVSDGIIFREIGFQEALQLVKKENKLLFVNVYADWCGACKLLKENTFQSKEVAAAVNSNFISIDINAEKGEGIDLSKRYEVTAHPLILIIDGDGKVKKRILGYKTDVQLINELKEFL